MGVLAVYDSARRPAVNRLPINRIPAREGGGEAQTLGVPPAWLLVRLFGVAVGAV